VTITDPFKIYIGWDPRDHLAYEIFVHSIQRQASIPIEIIALKDWQLRATGHYHRAFHTDGKGNRTDDRDGKPFSTDFSFTRFCVPSLRKYEPGWVMFADADMLLRADVAKLVELIDDSKALMCVKHDHQPPETEKAMGRQTQYERKNWSSLMLLEPSRNKGLTPYAVNNSTGNFLHRLLWLQDDAIGGLPEEWNWLEGWSSPDLEPLNVHYTRGTPDQDGYRDVPYADEWWDELHKETN
jgi:hypothetical protein